MAADIDACRHAGADDFVAKPASIGDIAIALERWVGDSPESVDSEAPDSELFEALLDDLGDYETVRSLGTTFLTELPGRVDAIVESGPTKEGHVELVAHTLASTSEIFGANELGRIAREIENTARSSSPVTDDQRRELQAIAATTEQTMRSILNTFEGGS